MGRSGSMMEENLRRTSLRPSKYQSGVVRYMGGQTMKVLENGLTKTDEKTI